MTRASMTILIPILLLAIFLSCSEGRCIDVPVEYCRRLGFTGTYFPNHFYHRSISEAVAAFDQFIAAEGECSDEFGKFVCAAYFPGCTLTNNVRVDIFFNPCRKLCNSVFKPCKLSFRRLKIRWPSELRCGSFPTKECTSVMEDLVPNVPTPAPVLPAATTQATPVCEAIGSTMCKEIGYDDVMMPNRFGQEIVQEAADELNKFAPLITVECSKALLPYLCLSYLPPCPGGNVQKMPCRSLCEAAKEGCVQMMRIVGYEWPEHLNCSILPTDNCFSIEPVDSSEVTASSTPVALEPSKCEDLVIPACKDLDYTSTLMPNMFGDNQKEAQLQIETQYEYLEHECSDTMKPFLCAIYAPRCSENKAQLPCRSLCEKAYMDCGFAYMNGFGWPGHLNCSALPTDDCYGFEDIVIKTPVDETPQCEQLIIPMCEDLYSSTMMPNMLGHKYQGKAYKELAYLSPIIEYDCSPAMKPFLCSAYAPVCEVSMTQGMLPCRSLCESAKNDCLPPLQKYGFNWPEELNCTVLPTDNCYGNDSIPAKPEPTCEPLNISICQDLGYSYTIMPNMMGHSLQQDAELTLRTFTPLLQYDCSPLLRPFLCAVFAPKCSSNMPPQLPCQSLCEQARDSCSPILQEFGYQWPMILNCTSLPTDNCYGNELISSKCEPLGITICEDLGYSETMMPNMAGHGSQEKAFVTIQSYYPLIQSGCSSVMKQFLCAFYAPSCSDNSAPCQSLCEQARDDCLSLMQSYGFNWPATLNCTSLPNDSCIGNDFSKETPVTPETSVIHCDFLTIPLCQNLEYTYTRIPNMFNHRSQEEAGQELHQFWPLVEVNCSPALKPFLCSLYAPMCPAKDSIPCRSLCETARDGCSPIMSTYGLSWPGRLNCSSFQNENCYDGGIKDEPLEMEGSCEEIVVPMCNSSYNETRMPNILGHKTQFDAMSAFVNNAIVYYSECSTIMMEFACSVYVPMCTPIAITKPCRNVCEQVKNDCQQFLSILSIPWPTDLECSQFTNDDPSCVVSGFLNETEPVILTPSSGQRCEPLINPYCQGLSYNTTSLPNMLRFQSQNETVTAMQSIVPLFFSTPCAAEVKLYACATFSPPCSDGPTLFPCRKLCEAVEEKCGDLFTSMSPDVESMFQCLYLPEENCYEGEVIEDIDVEVMPTVEYDMPTNGYEVGPVDVYGEGCNKIKSRRYDIKTVGLSEYFRGWVDVQGQGAANDYCRVVRYENGLLDFTCALAGSDGMSEFNYGFNADASEGFVPGRSGEWYVKDENDDGRDDYCRCVYLNKNLYVSCIPAMDSGFDGNKEFLVDVEGCGKEQFDPFIGPRS